MLHQRCQKFKKKKKKKKNKTKKKKKKNKKTNKQTNKQKNKVLLVAHLSFVVIIDIVCVSETSMFCWVAWWLVVVVRLDQYPRLFILRLLHLCLS